MALSKELEKQSLNDLKMAYYANRLSKKQIAYLTEINKLAAGIDICLSRQSQAVITLILTQLQKSSIDANKIHSLILEQLDRETDENKRRHQAQGHFNRENIHLRDFRSQLQDHDMSSLMPKSYDNIEVLAPINRFDRSTDLVQEGIAAALKDTHIRHIIIPVGPGHWRGVYLTKPVNDKDCFQLELFDPYGPSGANAIRQVSLGLLEKCGIKENRIEIKLTGPTHRQTDGYACGDFTCAHSHKKMQEFGATDTHYKQELITALEMHGNKDDFLRHTVREVSHGLTNVEMHELTPSEQQVLITTTSAQKNPTTLYKETIHNLIQNKDSIFSLARKANEKDAASEQLSDEELAAKLQAEEFTRVGIKPKG